MHADLPMTAAAYSSDGTVLAVGSRSIITLWHPESTARMAVLVAPSCPHTSTATHLAFLTDAPYLVSVHRGKRGCVCVWNLMTLTLWWATYAVVDDVAAHPVLPRFAAVIDAPEIGGSVVAVLGPDSATAEETLRSEGGVRVSRVMFPPPGCALHSKVCGKARSGDDVVGRGPMLVLTHDRRIVVVPDQEGEKTGAEARQRSGAGAATAVDAQADVVADEDSAPLAEQRGKSRVSGYAAMYGEPAHARVRDATAADTPQQAAAAAAEARGDAADILAIFDAPSHLLPPTAELCDGVLRMMLRRPRDAG